MADDSPTPPERAASGKGWNKKYLHVPLWGWTAGGAAVAGIGWWLWKRHQAAKAGQPGTTSTSTSTGLTASQYASLLNALGDLQGPGSTGGGGGTYGTYPGSSTSVVSSTTSPTSSTGGGAGGTSKAGTTTKTPTPVTKTSNPVTNTGSNWKFPAPTGLQAYDKAKNGYRLSWNAVKGPQGQVPSSYTVATYNSSGTLVDQFDTQRGNTNTAEYGRGGAGLPKGTYHTNVWANGGPQAPPHATVSVTLSA